MQQSASQSSSRHGSTNSTPHNSHSKSTAKLPPSGIPFGHLPAFLPGSASLVEQLDRRIMIVLRDGRHLVGVLRSFDQFSNMVMEDTSERRVLNVKVGGGGNGSNGGKGGKGVASTICYYTDIQLGLYLVRGDSMVLLGEVEVDHDTDNTDNTDSTNKDGKTSEEAKEKEQPGNDNANVDTSMTGSGLLGGPEKDVAEEKKKYMKKVTLEEFETLVEENQKQNGDGNSNGDGDDQGAVEQLTWEFDADLYV